MVAIYMRAMGNAKGIVKSPLLESIRSRGSIILDQGSSTIEKVTQEERLEVELSRVGFGQSASVVYNGNSCISYDIVSRQILSH
jgi:hypothetical protein